MPKTAVVVVSHYNAWPTDDLVRLLDQMQSIPAGHPFSVRVVVNQAEARPLELPPRHAEVPVFTRENTGYNIGAWDHGWRQGPPSDYYLFLQEECVLLKPDWLGAFIRVAARPKVGVVGEHISYYNMSWDDVRENSDRYHWDSRVDLFQAHLQAMGVPAGRRADHLRSLVLCLRRDVLEAIDGFRIGISKEEAIACEFAISKSVEAQGLQIRQVHMCPFHSIKHPQWEEDRLAAHGKGWLVRRFVSQYLGLGPLLRLRRERARRRRGGNQSLAVAPTPPVGEAVPADSTR